MPGPLEFTGERFTPECVREIRYEHLHRYALARRWCAGKRTLDAACGEGYGAAMLCTSASSVEAVDISAPTIEHARARYGHLQGLEFQVADCTALPFADGEFGCVVSFETLEHLAAQDELLAEFRRVLAPSGCLVLSSPERAVYSQGQAANEFHLKELCREELEALIGRHFPCHRLLGQKLVFHSAVWSLDGVERVSLEQVSEDGLAAPPGIGQAPMYYLALCAADPGCLPEVDGRLWLFDDIEESVYRHYQGEIRRNMAAGGIIAGLEEQIRELQKAAVQAPGRRKSRWWNFRNRP